MNLGKGGQFKTVAGNIGFATSYWIFPHAYGFYRIQKRLFNAVFRSTTPVLDEPTFHSDTVIIDGFRHSGNCFITSNVTPDDQHRLPLIRHRAWTIRAAVKRCLPVVVLIRSPKEVAESTFYRTTTDAELPFSIFPSAVLFAWIGYYRSILRLRAFLTVVSLDSIANDYRASCQTIEDTTGLRMNTDPIWTRVHRYTGYRWDVRLSWVSRILMRKADALYDLLLSHSTQSETRRDWAVQRREDRRAYVASALYDTREDAEA